MRIGDWFKKDIKIKILAFFLALLFWLYVSNVTNPFKSVTIYNVPVTVVNEDYLSQNNFELKNTPRTFIDITIRGRQDGVDKVRPTDFEVFPTIRSHVGASGSSRYQSRVPVQECDDRFHTPQRIVSSARRKQDLSW